MNTIQNDLIGLKVFVYFNLHKKCWSVRHNGKVIAHLQSVCLYNAKFKVSQAGRLRVIQEKRKNVHAGVFGTIIAKEDYGYQADTPVTYNPYRFETFVTKFCHNPVYQSDIVYMDVANFIPTVLTRLYHNLTEEIQDDTIYN
jgi:hypothetical protein